MTPNITLTIEAGTYIEFQGHFKLDVDGAVIANGTAADMITFTTVESNRVLDADDNGWGHIIYKDNMSSAVTSKFDYCIIEYAYNSHGGWINGFGGAFTISGANAKLEITNSIIRNNKSKSRSAALYCNSANIKLINNLFTNNDCTVSPTFGVIYLNGNESSEIINNTIVNNTTCTTNGGLYATTCAGCTLKNTILRNNGGGELSVSNIPVTYCNIEGWTGGGDGNIDVDPIFTNVNVGDYSITTRSPCINTGDTATTTTDVGTTDLAGNARIFDGLQDVIDIGAYELQSEPTDYLILSDINAQRVLRIQDTVFKYLLVAKTRNPANNVSYSFLDSIAGMTIDKDTIKWTSVVDSMGTTTKIRIKGEVNNGSIKDTVEFNLYVYNINEIGGVITKDLTISNNMDVIDNIKVANNVTLTVNPGVAMEFKGQYKLDVKGTLNAVGTHDNMIKFTIPADSIISFSDTTGGWNGIKFIHTDADAIVGDTSLISYCILEYGRNAGGKGGAVYIDHYDNVIVSNSIIRNNNAGDRGGAISLWYSSAKIIGNLIYNNYGEYGGAISCYATNHPKTNSNALNEVIINNTIINNTTGTDNVGGIRLESSSGIFKNNIIYGNTGEQIKNTNGSGEMTISNCNVKFTTIANLVDGGQNIDADPKFTDAGDYSLKTNSPCINAGDPNSTIETIGVTTDLAGNSRIWDNTAITNDYVDIGAYELQEEPNFSLTITDVNEQFFTDTTEFRYLLEINSFPEAVTYNFLESIAGMTIDNDTIKWTFNKDSLNTSNLIRIEADNGEVKDTVEFTFNVLDGLTGHITVNTTISENIDIVGDLTIDTNVTLTIEPGVILNFRGHYKIDVKGAIRAIGTHDNMITFTAADQTEGWAGIKIDNTTDTIIGGPSLLSYCILEYGRNTNGGAIYIQDYSAVTIENSILRHNKATSRGGAISSFLDASVKIVGNLIHHNTALYGGGIDVVQTPKTAEIINNTIIYNTATSINGDAGGAIRCQAAEVTIKNNLIFGNHKSLDKSQCFAKSEGTDLLSTYSYCNIEGGLISSGSNTAFVDGGTNIDVEPLFLDSANADFSLQDTSLCINAGDPTDTTTTIGITLDLNGNQRVYNDRIDIGAYENQTDSVSGVTNYAPSEINLSSDTIAENSAIGTVIGTLTATDPDANDTFTFTLTGTNNNNASYEIAGDTLKAKVEFDYETNAKDTVEITVADNGGETYTKTFTILIKNVAETTSILSSDNKKLNILTIYPNPATTEVTAEYSLTKNAEVSLKLYNLQGALVKTILNETQVKGNYSEHFTVNNLPKGVYLLHIKVENEIDVKKLIVN